MKEKTKDSVKTFTDHVEDFINTTFDARIRSERCRDYYDGLQWTEEEAAKLRRRKQAPLVINRVKPKVNGLLGLYSIRKTDPKAYPRTQKHDKTAEVVTDALRFVADNTDFEDGTSVDVAENVFIEGYGGVFVDIKQTPRGDIEIDPWHIPWDRIFFDTRSRKRDFSDARYMGVMQWMDEDELTERFGKVDLDAMVDSSIPDETFEDRPRWAVNDSNRKRYRIAIEFYKKEGKWNVCIYGGNMFLLEPQLSPFLDEDGEPCNPIELVSAFINRENERYGEVASFLDPQDEINHRRSKALHLLSQRQTFSNKKAGVNVIDAKRELSKPDGHLELKDGELNKDFGILPTGDMARGQFDLYLDAKGEMDATSYNAQLSGERQSGDLSGKAIDRLQQAGTIELNRLYVSLSGWKKRVYRQIWARIKQFWTEEKWIRVTDDQDNLRWIGLNSQVTVQKLLEETINDDSKPLEMRVGASAIYQPMIQAQDPRLQQIVEVKNDVAELDVDIIIDQSFDTVNIQQEQFQVLAQFAQSSKDIDIIELIELSQLRGKDELIEKIEQRRQQAAQSNGNAQQMQAMQSQAQARKTLAEAANKEQEAAQRQIENTLLIANPPTQVSSVSV